MSADHITYSLERLDSYRQFELFCCALLAGEGYGRIDPLGGSGDRGRDAIIWGSSNEPATMFAFTVRKDWLAKFQRDCARLKATQGTVSKLVFVCTSVLTAAEKDKTRQQALETYKSDLDLFDLERLRIVLMKSHQRHLIQAHPAIFQLAATYAPPVPFAQAYLLANGELLSAVANSSDHLAVEIDAELYGGMQSFLYGMPQAELTCFDAEAKRALEKLHAASALVWEVISDHHDIRSGWRVKFNNFDPAGTPPQQSVQRVLLKKKELLGPRLVGLQLELQAFSNLAGRGK